jgi:ATPase subunit of ABC transporter with duplicated ATPase domains
MLTRLYVNNFRCFVNFECRFGSKQLLLGPNGVGKSSIFDVLSLLRDFSALGESAEGRFGGSSRTRWLNMDPQMFELDVTGNDGSYKYWLEVDSWGVESRPRVIREDMDFDGKPIFRSAGGEVHLFNDKHEKKVHYPFDWHRSALATITERQDNTKLSWFKRWLSGLLCISPDPRQMSAVASREARYPERDLANFAAWYRHHRQETGDYAYLDDLREVIPGFSGMSLSEVGEGRREIIVEMTSRASDKFGAAFKLAFRELSDGQRVLIGLYAALHFAFRSDTTLCFDEPDNFVALREVQPWLDQIIEKVEDESSNTQVLIASHHPELLDRLAVEDGISLDRPDGLLTRAQPFRDPAETGLTPSSLISRGWDRE